VTEGQTALFTMMGQVPPSGHSQVPRTCTGHSGQYPHRPAAQSTATSSRLAARESMQVCEKNTGGRADHISCIDCSGRDHVQEIQTRAGHSYGYISTARAFVSLIATTAPVSDHRKEVTWTGYVLLEQCLTDQATGKAARVPRSKRKPAKQLRT
jgi:hypothetical protein